MVPVKYLEFILDKNVTMITEGERERERDSNEVCKKFEWKDRKWGKKRYGVEWWSEMILGGMNLKVKWYGI